MNYLLDTCVISDFMKKDLNTLFHFENNSPKQIHISTITLMEIEYGLKLNPERQKNIRPIWTPLLQHINILPYTELCAISTASIRSNLKTSGLSIGPFDILLAGTALANNLILVTSNIKEFNRIPEISIENWRDKKLSL